MPNLAIRHRLDEKQRAAPNTLTASEKHRLNTWVVDNWEEILTKKWNKTEICSVAQKRLGLEKVTLANINSCLKATGKKMPARAGLGNPWMIIGKDGLESMIQQIIVMCRETGIPLHQDFQDFVTKFEKIQREMREGLD